MKNRRGNTLLGILFILIGLGFIGTSIYMTMTKEKEKPAEEEKKEDEDDEEEEVKKVTVVLNDNEKNGLFKLLPIASNINKAEGEGRFSPFQDKKVSVDDMSMKWTLVKVTESVQESDRGDCTTDDWDLNGICEYTISTKKIKSIIDNNYNFKSYKLLDKFSNNYIYNCTLSKDEDHYACSNSGGGRSFANKDLAEYINLFGDNAIYKYVKADKDKENLYVYYKYAFVEFVYDSDNSDATAEDITFKLYTSSDKTTEIDEEVLSVKDYYEEDAKTSFSDKIIKKYDSKMQDYVITYKIDGENYKLVSVEPIKSATK